MRELGRGLDLESEGRDDKEGNDEVNEILILEINCLGN